MCQKLLMIMVNIFINIRTNFNTKIDNISVTVLLTVAFDYECNHLYQNYYKFLQKANDVFGPITSNHRAIPCRPKIKDMT